METRASRFLEFSLLVVLVVHVVAMVSMAVLLMPAMPGAINTDQVRITYIAHHPWLWHLGWLPWHLCALSDLLLAIAMLKTPWIPKMPACITTLFTVLAVAVEQPAEYLWNVEGARLASVSIAAGTLAPYLDFEGEMFLLVGSIAAILYAIMAFGWTWSFARAGTWNRYLTWLSAITWTLLLFTAAAPLLPESIQPSLLLIGVGNGIGFSLMALWMVLVLEAVLRRSRPDGLHGQMKPWRHPRSGLLGRILTLVGNSRLLRYLGEFLPSTALISDIEDVIYINFIVDANQLEKLVPPGLSLQRLGPNGAYGLFSILTYRHGHFGPRFSGGMRNLLSSPVQSNWRIHVQDRNDVQGIFFVATVVNDTLVSLGGRSLADGVPMHVASNACVTASGGSEFLVELKPGDGSAPDLYAKLKACPKPQLTGAWQECFGDFNSFLAYCVPQDRAMSTQTWYQQSTKQEIDLGIPLESCESLCGDVVSNSVTDLIGAFSPPICFRVPKVKFALERVERGSYQ
ncbi:MAG: DUF2071 domain-containing protein [Candidatus Melainabacteria bacterium]|nr:DUF2071 domain-containing protein [Candidatus Melainabacteria bacterium]